MENQEGNQLNCSHRATTKQPNISLIVATEQLEAATEELKATIEQSHNIFRATTADTNQLKVATELLKHSQRAALY